MELSNYPSKILAEAVEEFANLPGIGKRTALRLVLHLLKQGDEEVKRFGNAIVQLKNNIKRCKICNTVADDEVCGICSNPHRDKKLVCVVESIRDIMAIESTHQFNGHYHVLNGLISPMDGIGPNDLEIKSLIQKAESGDVDEIILALSTTMEGDTTNFYLFRKLEPFGIALTTLARGVSIGDELEYADEITLGRSIANRTPFESTLNQK
jgi:recombination protein RecR